MSFTLPQYVGIFLAMFARFPKDNVIAPDDLHSWSTPLNTFVSSLSQYIEEAYTKRGLEAPVDMPPSPQQANQAVREAAWDYFQAHYPKQVTYAGSRSGKRFVGVRILAPSASSHLSAAAVERIPKASISLKVNAAHYNATPGVPSRLQGDGYVTMDRIPSVAKRPGCAALQGSLGSGTYGHVYLGKTSNSTDVAVKLFGNKAGAGGCDQEAEAVRMVQGLEGVVTLLGANVLSNSTHFLVYKYYSGGDLHTMLHSARGNLDFRVRFGFLLDVLRACASFACCGLVHGDIKENNILVGDLSGVLRAFVADFGVAAVQNGLCSSNKLRRYVPAHYWVAPEVHTSLSGGWTDLFSVAKLAILLLTGDSRHPLVIALRASNSFASAEMGEGLGPKWLKVLSVISTASSVDITTRKTVTVFHLWFVLAEALASESPPPSFLAAHERPPTTVLHPAPSVDPNVNLLAKYPRAARLVQGVVDAKNQGRRDDSPQHERGGMGPNKKLKAGAQ